MKKELTEKESKSIDISLKLYLDKHQKSNILKIYFTQEMEDNGINENRFDDIYIELNSLNILTYKNDRGDKVDSAVFNRDEVTELLKNGGMFKKWIDRESKRVNIKLINKTLSEFCWTKWIAGITAFFTLILGVLKLIEVYNSFS